MSDIVKGIFKKLGKQRVIYLATVIFSILFIWIGGKICSTDMFGHSDSEYYEAEVVSIVSVVEDDKPLDSDGTEIPVKRVTFNAEMKSGPYEGDVVQAVQDIDSLYAYQSRQVKEGDEILLSRPAFDLSEEDEATPSDVDSDSPVGEGEAFSEEAATYSEEETLNTEAEAFEEAEYVLNEDRVEWVFIEFNRIDSLIWLCVLFLFLIVLIGRKKGFSAILALAFTVLAIFMVYIPSILRGFNIYLMTIIISAFTIFVSLVILNGWNFKTICAIIGNMSGVAIAGILAIIVNSAIGITGILEPDYVYLQQMDSSINLRAIVWGGILIGALGAIMDVSMTIASAMKELNDTMEKKTFFRMLKSGMNIGRDAIGTMTNTLILAYIGGSLATVLLLVVHQNVYYLFNMEMIMVEIISAVVGSIGILAAVPATAVVSAYVFNRFEEKQ